MNNDHSDSTSEPTQEIVSSAFFCISKTAEVDTARNKVRRYHDFLKNHRKAPEKLAVIELLNSGCIHSSGKGEAQDLTSQPLFTTGDDYQKVWITKRVIHLKPESIIFLAQLEGVAKNLLLYLILMQDDGTLDFVWSKREVSQFNDFCNLVTGKAPSKNSVEKAIKTLKDINAVKSWTRCRLKLNPFITTPHGASLESSFDQFVFSGIVSISKKLSGSKDFVRKHLFPKTKPTSKKAKVSTLHPEQNRAAS